MTDLINTWQFNLVSYLFFVVVFSQSYRLAVRSAKNDGVATATLQFIAGLTAVLLIPLFGFKLPENPLTYLFLGISCLLWALNNRLQTVARKNMPVSLFVIIERSAVIFLVIIGFIFFKDPFTWPKVAGACLIVFATMMAQWTKGGLKINRYAIYALVTALTFAIAVSVDIVASKGFSLPLYISLTLFLPMLIIISVEKIKPSSLIEEFRNGNKLHYLLTGISWTLTIIFMLRAYRFGQVTIITPLSAIGVILNVVSAYFIQKEKENLWRKIVAGLVACVGIYLTIL